MSAAFLAATKAEAAGYIPQERRFPVLIDPDGFLSSPEQLRNLLDLPEIPVPLDTSWTKSIDSHNDVSWADEEQGDPALICHLNYEELAKLKAKTALTGMDQYKLVWFQGDRRCVTIVHGRKGDMSSAETARHIMGSSDSKQGEEDIIQEQPEG
ncbi:hypothetical protein ACHAQH_006350 [Verticillium albo-atrum]